MTEILEKAYAKVNFGLKILNQSESGDYARQGFHCIESIFQTVDLCDTLRLYKDSSAEKENGCCRILCNSMKLPEKNTINTVYQAFCEISGVSVPSVCVELTKGIPAGGGLGGGSSDAAAVARGLEKLCGIKLSSEGLYYLAEKTGSDVFFFMNCNEDGTGTALVSGRGDKVKRIKSRKDLILLLIFPEESSSTKEAYALVDEMLESLSAKNADESQEVRILHGMIHSCPDFSGLETVYNSPLKEWSFVNYFTPVLKKKLSEVNNALEDLKKCLVPFSEMSGSGSTVFGVFDTLEQAQVCYDRLAQKYRCKIVRAL